MIEKLVNLADRAVETVKELQFFDSNVWIGKPFGFPMAGELKVEGIQDAYAKHHITGSLISHWMGVKASPQAGNEALCKIASTLSENDYLMWTALPLYPKDTGCLPGCQELDRKLRAVRIFPKTHHFALKSWQLGSLCDFLVERSLPLFIQHVELDWDDMYDFAKENPDLKIIIESQANQKILYHSRPLFAMMKELSNIQVEISNFVGPGFIEYAVGQFGAERLIYGSFMPVSDPFVPMGMVLNAQISKSDKKLIAGDNMRRLIERVQL